MHVARVTRINHDGDAGHYFAVSIQQAHLTASNQGIVVVADVAHPIAFELFRPVLPFPTLRVVGCVRKGGFDFSVFIAEGVPPTMVKVKVRVDDDFNFLATNAHCFQFAQQLRLSVVYLGQFVRKLVADAGFNQHQSAQSSHQYRICPA